MSLWQSERIWSKTEWIWIDLSAAEWIWSYSNEIKWIWMRLCEILWIWANLCETAWSWANLCEIARIWMSQSKSEWDWVDLGETEWIWVRMNGSNKSERIRLGMRESLRVRCKTPSKTSETPPFPPISYPALAGLIGIWYPTGTSLAVAHMYCSKLVYSQYHTTVWSCCHKKIDASYLWI